MKCKATIIKVEAPKMRNPFALHAKLRKAVRFKDKREAKGGARNVQREYQDQS